MGAVVDTYLEERSKLIFEFYSAEVDSGVTYRILDFWENIKIKESQKPNLITYNPISRAGSLYSYGGAKSRAFNLSFNITLPNLTLIRERWLSDISKYSSDHFFQNSVDKDFGSPPGLRADVGFFDNQFLYLLDNYSPTDVKLAFPSSNFDIERNSQEELDPITGDATDNTISSFNATEVDTSRRQKTIATVMMWVGLIRSSVINNSKNPLEGPPIVRLRHGILYQDVPCVCTGYDVSFEERGGYDLHTLLPRIINVSMNLEEYRNNGEFKKGIPKLRDNLTGWESIINNPHSADPGYGPSPTVIAPTGLYQSESWKLGEDPTNLGGTPSHLVP